MKEKHFKNWLIDQKFETKTINTRVSNCKRIEKNQYDLDTEFNKDKGKNLLSILNYTKKEKDNGISPKHKIQIDGNELTGTSTLRYSANLYFLFCQSLDRFIVPTTKLVSDITVIENNKTINEEEKKMLIKYRLGQSEYRKRLVEYWEGCSVSGCSYIDILIASHIKPWSESDNDEKYDVYNGLLLTPNYDKLFDRYLISFDDKGLIIISNKLTDIDLKLLNISKTAKLNSDKMTVDHITYLQKHRENLE